MNTKQKGDISEAQVLAALLRFGCNVLVPFGDRNRYDFVVEENGAFTRIQVKTAQIIKDTVRFKVCSVTRKNGKCGSAPYHGQIDFFMSYCPENGAIYSIPISSCGKRSINLQLSKNVRKNGRAAKDFEFNGRFLF